MFLINCIKKVECISLICLFLGGRIKLLMGTKCLSSGNTNDGNDEDDDDVIMITILLLLLPVLMMMMIMVIVLTIEMLRKTMFHSFQKVDQSCS